MAWLIALTIWAALSFALSLLVVLAGMRVADNRRRRAEHPEAYGDWPNVPAQEEEPGGDVGVTRG